MGKYINSTSQRALGASASDKCRGILEDGGQEIDNPNEYLPNLVCVVDNGMFGAAAYIYSPAEFNAFNDWRDPRPKRWFIWDKAESFSQ